MCQVMNFELKLFAMFLFKPIILKYLLIWVIIILFDNFIIHIFSLYSFFTLHKTQNSL